MTHINIIGAGLAGCEAAWAAANRGVKVRLFEMKGAKMSPAHSNPDFAELVCSNSLRSEQDDTASGLLKMELTILGSLILEAAHATRVAAGGALAVDREKFAAYVTEKIRSHPNIEVHDNSEVTEIDQNEITIIATGPLTSDTLSEHIRDHLAPQKLHFFDAAAPIIEANTIDMELVFAASRYDKGGADYLNCAMNTEEYAAFLHELLNARLAELKDFDREAQGDLQVFEGCMPIEVLASRGEKSLLFGPLKPVGLTDPRTGKRPHAVLQLRRENIEGTCYNLVGFQTRLAFPEQKRIFRMIPGLENAEFLRYGVMHRNTYLNSPDLLEADYSMTERPNVFFAGQITGVEGYVESTSSGMVAGINAARRAMGEDSIIFPDITMIGALAHYASGYEGKNFQPSNANFGIIRPHEQEIRRKGERNAAYVKRATEWMEKNIL